MTATHHPTPEEEAFERLLAEHWQTLSEAARNVISEARNAAYAEYMVNSYGFGPEDYEEAMERMLLAVAETTEGDRELLKEFVRRSLAASASVDRFDMDTIVGHRVHLCDVHYYYVMVANMVTDTLREWWRRERLAELEPIDDSDIPF